MKVSILMGRRIVNCWIERQGMGYGNRLATKKATTISRACSIEVFHPRIRQKCVIHFSFVFEALPLLYKKHTRCSILSTTPERATALANHSHILGQIVEMGFSGAQAGKVKDGMDVQTTLEILLNGSDGTEDRIASTSATKTRTAIIFFTSYPQSTKHRMETLCYKVDFKFVSLIKRKGTYDYSVELEQKHQGIGM
jgi:hypothetical protein